MLLRNPLFAALWLASCLSVLGTTLQEVAGSWLMTSLHPSPLLVSLVSVASNLPLFLLALPAGAMADLVDRRRYLIGCQLWMMLVSGAMAALDLQAGSLLALTFLMGIGAALNSPGWHSVTPEIVSREDLPAAIAWNGTAITTARTLGPALGGWLVARWGASLAFGLNSLSFLGVVLTLLAWRRHRVEMRPETLGRAVLAGLRFLRESPALRRVLVRTLAFVVPAAAPYALLPLLVKQVYAGGADEFGGLVTAFGVGSVLGSGWRRWNPNLSVTLASLGYALALSALGHWPDWRVGCAAQAVAGVAWMLALNQFHLGVQLTAPDWVRSRATAVFLLALFGGSSLGGLLWGAAATAWGLRRALEAAALLALLATVGHRCAPMPAL